MLRKLKLKPPFMPSDMNYARQMGDYNDTEIENK